MFYALRQTVTAKSPQAAGMGNWAQGAGATGSTPGPAQGPAPGPSPHLIPNPADFPCPRSDEKYFGSLKTPPLK